MSDPWVQLDGVEQILPFDGWEFELLRRKVLDCLYQNGYELVVPPLADFVESLLGGTNEDLDLLTVKAPDYASGKLYGIRADMTPQLARMAALHLPVQESAIRLCYFGSTLLARVPKIGGHRELLQFGAELFGSSSQESDREIIRLMVECLKLAGIQSLSLSMGHVGVIREILRAYDIDSHQDAEILSMLRRKSVPDLQDFFSGQNFSSSSAANTLCELTALNGDIAIVKSANHRLRGLSPGLDQILAEFEDIVRKVSAELTDVSVHVDYSQTGGYQYHTGVIFSAYGPGYGQALAKGGRYDNVLSVYGSDVPATGFSGDLRLLRDAIHGKCRKGILVSTGLDV